MNRRLANAMMKTCVSCIRQDFRVLVDRQFNCNMVTGSAILVALFVVSAVVGVADTVILKSAYFSNTSCKIAG